MTLCLRLCIAGLETDVLHHVTKQHHVRADPVDTLVTAYEVWISGLLVSRPCHLDKRLPSQEDHTPHVTADERLCPGRV